MENESIRNRRVLVLLACFLLFAALFTSCAQTHNYEPVDRYDWKDSGTKHFEGYNIQAMFGVTKFDEDELSYEKESSTDPTLDAESDLSTLPLIGAAGQMPLIGETIQGGLEGGFFFSWWRDEVRARSSGGTTIVVIDNSLILTEIFFGGYASADLGDKFRIYAGAGPLLMFGRYELETEDTDEAVPVSVEEDETASAFGAGGYVRAGVDYMLTRNSSLGLGVRAIKTRLDFDDEIGKVDLEGIQGMLVYSVRF